MLERRGGLDLKTLAVLFSYQPLKRWMRTPSGGVRPRFRKNGSKEIETV
jgi:hypothetical protein